MNKLRTALSLFRHARVRHWPGVSIYIIGWVVFRLFRIRLFRKRILRLREFAVSADVEGVSGLEFLYEVLEKSVYDYASLRDSGVKTIFDVGANCGFFALTQCARSDRLRVFCFEPHPRSFQRLKNNIAVNALEHRIVPVHAAAGASQGRCVLNLLDDSSMGVVSTAGSRANASTADVELISLDDFATRSAVKPDLLKVDVEGFEVQVLKGASQCLAHARHVILECHSEELTRECRAILESARFDCVVRGALMFGSKKQ